MVKIFRDESEFSLELTRLSGNLKALTTPLSQYIVGSADLFAGCVAGVSGKLVEYPFDTVKVKLQCQAVSKALKPMGTYQCFRDIMRFEGFSGFYRGLSAPMLGSVLENVVLFVTYHKIQHLIAMTTSRDSTAPLTLPQLTLSGGLAGMVVSGVLTPVELIKTKMQIHGSQAYKGPIDCMLKTIRGGQGLRGLYKGHSATFARECFGGAAWFGVYEWACQEMMSRDGHKSKDELHVMQLMLAGALSGIAYNTILFPADVVKSQIQADQSGDRNYLRRLRHLYEAEGPRGLYRGYGVTLLRAVPANAVILASFELASRALKL